MGAGSCSQCLNTRWIRYFSETLDGDFEEAFMLCPCNHKLKADRQSIREESQSSETAAEELANVEGVSRSCY
jgi:hypothetical protein